MKSSPAFSNTMEKEHSTSPKTSGRAHSAPETARADLQSHVSNVKEELVQAVTDVGKAVSGTSALTGLAREELGKVGSDVATHLALSQDEVAHYIGQNPPSQPTSIRC
jgi:hypothetical protein